MTKMTQSLRDDIVHKACEKAGIIKRGADLHNRRAAWAEAIRIDSLGGKSEELEKLQARFMKILKDVPEEFRGCGELVYTRSYLMLNCAGMRIRVNEWEGCKPAKREHVITADHPLAVEFEKIIAEEASLEKDRDTLRSQVKAAVAGFTTVAKLLKAWPEARELLPSKMDEAKPQLPAVQVADLNKLVGLPSDQQSEAA